MLQNKLKLIMTKEFKIALILFLLGCSNMLFGQIQTKKDTISCRSKNIIIEYPINNRVNALNYEEGFFKTINCVLDTAVITIHCGSMVNLPLTDFSDKTICSEFVLCNDIKSIKGYHIVNGREKFFREDNYFKYNITIVYENVEKNRLMIYENIFNNIKIINNTRLYQIIFKLFYKL